MNPPKVFLNLCAGLMIAACATCGVATAQQTPADRADAALAYAQCMRDNGYAEFPDPTPDGGIQFLVAPEHLPRFQTAAAACQQLVPAGLRGEDIPPDQLDVLLKLSQCVRQHGVPDFPDPSAQGSFDLSATSIGSGGARLDGAIAACDATGLRQSGGIVIGG